MHRRTHRRRLTAAAVAVGLLLAACGGTEEAAEEAAPAPAPAPAPEEAEECTEAVVLGGTLGLTGALSAAAGHYLSTYEFWADRVNAEGGLLGCEVEVLVYDDESNPTGVTALYEKLLNEDQIDLVMGPYATFMTLPVIPLVEEAEKVMFMAGAVTVASNRASDWLVSSYTYQDDTFALGFFRMIDDLPADQRPERLGVFALQNPYTLAMANGVEGVGGIKNMAAERGIEIVVYEEYAGDVTDFAPLVRKAQDADVDALIVANLLGDGLAIARAVNEQGFNPDILCMCGSQVTLLAPWKDLGAAGERVFGTTMAWETDGYDGYDELAEHFRGLGLDPMPTYAQAAYVALQVAEQAVEATGSLDQAVIRDYITAGNPFNTVVGEVRFDENGIPGWNSIMLQVQDGANQVVWPAARATSEAVFPLGG